MNHNPQGHFAAVSTVAFILLMMLLLPSVILCYRLEPMEDLADLFDRKEESSDTTEKVWKHDLPLLVNLLKSMEAWERQRTREKESETPERTIHHSKRAREQIFGAMPPLGELCRMMGYASCPH